MATVDATKQQPSMTLPSDQNASGRTLGDDEMSLLSAVIESGVLNSTKGTFVKELEKEFAELLGAKHCWACSSGSAAIHTAVAAIDPEPGDEFITTSITDMGALTAILFQGGIPVFADVDPETYNVTAESIERCISPKTKAIVVTHLFGNPCDMTAIVQLAEKHGLPIIEDCAQAFMARHADQDIGRLGTIGCFSFQQGKHITTGEGGLIITDDDKLARRMFLFINKAWGYGDEKPDHYFLAPNYRMTELQGAVAVGQLKKLADVVETRVRLANIMNEKLAGIDGVETPLVTPNSVHTYWKYCLQVDGNVIKDGAVGLASQLRDHGIASAPRYIQKPAFMCEIFQKQRTFGNSKFPFTLARPEAVDYDPAKFPGTYDALERVLVLPWNEKYTEDHLDYIANHVRNSAETLRKDK